MLVLENVTKAYGATSVLSNISLTVAKGEIFGLAGSSGGGKSTLLRCIQGLENIDAGAIHCAAKKGFMFQDFQLFPHMTVLKNLTFAPSLQNKDKGYEARALELLQTLGLSDKVNAYPHQLSGGQKQRVALGRSLTMQPQLLLCDEPTSGLDVATIDDVVSLLKTVRDWGVTIVIASHDLDFLTRIADRIVLLKAGKIVANIAPQSTKDPVNALRSYY